LIDLEQVASPAAMPAGFLSLTTDCGATPDDGEDDGQKLQACVDRARMDGKGVFIPQGTFELSSQLQSNMGVMLSDVAIVGAGMWYSVLHGLWAQFHCTGSNCRFSDFAIRGDTKTRDDSQPFNGFNGSAGTGSRLDRICRTRLPATPTATIGFTSIQCSCLGARTALQFTAAMTARSRTTSAQIR
jgi:hypothetical protein